MRRRTSSNFLESLPMAPQPLSRVCSHATIILNNAGHRALSERPDLAILVSEAINSWSQVEAFLLRLFVALLGGNSALSAKIYLALEIQTAKTAALAEAVKNLSDPAKQQLVKAVVAISKTNQKHRDKLAHHVWGISPHLPDALLLADPKVFVIDGSNYSDIYVYRANDLREIIDANDRLCGYGMYLLRIVTDHPTNEGNRLFDELCNQPEIQERLRPQASQAQSAPRESS
jgi:hypothetical protein